MENDMQNVLTLYSDQVRRLYGDKLNSIILFGSYARNEQRPDPDLEIM